MEIASDVVKTIVHTWTRTSYEVQIDFNEPFTKQVSQIGHGTTLCMNYRRVTERTASRAIFKCSQFAVFLTYQLSARILFCQNALNYFDVYFETINGKYIKD